jgi:hypothetical protein
MKKQVTLEEQMEKLIVYVDVKFLPLYGINGLKDSKWISKNELDLAKINNELSEFRKLFPDSHFNLRKIQNYFPRCCV